MFLKSPIGEVTIKYVCMYIILWNRTLLVRTYLDRHALFVHVKSNSLFFERFQNFLWCETKHATPKAPKTTCKYITVIFIAL